ncbi:MAG: TrmH family RNA methyltransferase [bacterium]
MHLEGQQSVLSALHARRRKFKLILLKSGAHQDRFREILSEAEQQKIPVEFVPGEKLNQVAFGKTHGGVVALCTRKRLDALANLDKILSQKPGWPLLLLLEGVEDVRHLGYVLRSAEALGTHAVLLKKHLWDFDETVLSRTSSGAFDRLPVIKLSEASELKKLARFDIKVWGCLANARRSLYEFDLNRPLALAVGGEKRGLSGSVRAECDGFLRIPMAPGSASSLSVTHAACLLLGEAARQRFFAALPDANLTPEAGDSKS